MQVQWLAAKSVDFIKVVGDQFSAEELATIVDGILRTGIGIVPTITAVDGFREFDEKPALKLVGRRA